MKSLIISPLLIALLSMACGSSRETTTATAPAAQTESAVPVTSTTTVSTSPEMTTSNDMSSKIDDKYRFIISFISIGEGTDITAKDIMDEVIKKWQEIAGKELAVEKVIWGREGEVDYCFQLNELNEKEQEEFIQEIKKAMEGKNLIQITENEPCVHKR